VATPTGIKTEKQQGQSKKQRTAVFLKVKNLKTSSTFLMS
jgi:hypothetical protein